MHEIFVVGQNLTDAYHKAIKELYYKGEECECPDYNTSQKEVSMTMVVENALQEPMISKLMIGEPESLEQYKQEILDGVMDFEVEKGNWDYTYHSRMGKQIEFVIDELKRNTDSRRAVIDVRDNTHDMKSDSPACLQHIQYFIRDNKLHCKLLMRSNDAVRAAFMNAFAFIMLQKKIADAIGVEVGSYTHRANSFHVYKNCYDMLEGYVKKIETESSNNTYNYIGDWDEIMEESKESISNKINKLRNN